MANLNEVIANMLMEEAYLRGGGGKKSALDKVVSGAEAFDKIGTSFSDIAKNHIEKLKLQEEAKKAQRANMSTSELAGIPSQESVNLGKQSFEKAYQDYMAKKQKLSGMAQPEIEGMGYTVPVEPKFEDKRAEFAKREGYSPEELDMTPEEVNKARMNRYIQAGTPLRESQTVKNLREPISKPGLTTPVISGGIATREFVKMLKPDLREGEDMPYGEYVRRAALLQAETTSGQPRPISSEQVDKITQVRTAITGLGDIKDQYFKLLGEGKSPVDPIEGRWTNFKSRLGVMDDTQVSKFQTDLVAQLNTYLNALSGAAITEQEAVRLRARLPQIGTTNEQFLGQMDSFDSELKRALGSRISTLKDAGFRIGDLDRFIIKKEPSKLTEPTVIPKSSFKSADDILNAYLKGK